MNATRAIVAPVLSALACIVLAPQTDAVEVSRIETVPAVVACKPATKASRDQLRFRPISVQNQSNQNAFVSCAFENTKAATRRTGNAGIILSQRRQQ